MKNIFNFEYQTETLNNQDGTKSRFGVVYGENGNIVHTKKDTYHMVSTESVSQIANAINQQGYEISSFCHRHGEVIGFQVNLGIKPTKIGDISYEAVLLIPNNGKGVGITYLKEKRLICTNGMMRTLGSQVVKIPHRKDYKSYLEIAEATMSNFLQMVEMAQKSDESLTEYVMHKWEAKHRLATWFHKHETDGKLSLNQLREALYKREGVSNVIMAKYDDLMAAFEREVGYNEDLELNLSMYTLLATVTNYLTRRREQRASKLHDVMRQKRDTAKVEDFIAYLEETSIEINE